MTCLRTMLLGGLATTLLLACPASDDSGTDDANDDAVDSTAAMTGATSMADGMDDDPTTAATAADSSGDGELGPCDPAADEDACGLCVKGMCCPELEACAADTGCTCFRECAETMGMANALMCAADCGVDVLDLETTTGQIATCTTSNCAKCLG